MKTGTFAKRSLWTMLFAVWLALLGPGHAVAMGGHCVAGSPMMQMVGQGNMANMSGGADDEGANPQNLAMSSCAVLCIAQAPAVSAFQLVPPCSAETPEVSIQKMASIWLRPDPSPPRTFT